MSEQIQTVRCPNCKTDIPLSEALSRQIEDKLRTQMEFESKKKEDELAQKTLALSTREKQLELSTKSLQDQITQQVKAQAKKIEEEARQKALEQSNLQLADLQQQLKEKQDRLQQAQQQELELRKKGRELEEQQKDFELRLSRKLDEERKNIEEQTVQRYAEERRLKEREREKVIEDLKKQIDDLKRRAEQGSQQTQGEVQELDLEEILKLQFPSDEIVSIAVGVRGADVLQKVYSPGRQCCGTILWESKRTKAWSDNWIEKLKDDQRNAKAEIAIIVTATLPKDQKTFDHVKGVWITDYQSAMGLVTALRISLMQVHQARIALDGKNEKMEFLYKYFSGNEFYQRVQGIVEAFVAMRNQLNQEKNAMIKIWSQREKQIDRVLQNSSAMYGDVQGIIGGTLPEIPMLELKALPEPSVDGKAAHELEILPQLQAPIKRRTGRARKVPIVNQR